MPERIAIANACAFALVATLIGPSPSFAQEMVIEEILVTFVPCTALMNFIVSL